MDDGWHDINDLISSLKETEEAREIIRRARLNEALLLAYWEHKTHHLPEMAIAVRLGCSVQTLFWYRSALQRLSLTEFLLLRTYLLKRLPGATNDE